MGGISTLLRPTVPIPQVLTQTTRIRARNLTHQQSDDARLSLLPGICGNGVGQFTSLNQGTHYKTPTT